jgi:predicted ABC-type ATPase
MGRIGSRPLAVASSLNQPHVIVLAGPNGAGKSSAAPSLLVGALEVTGFVNADSIAVGLSAFNSERYALEAGRLMLERLRGLAEERVNFAFETTLASRSFAPWIRDLIAAGYAFHLFYLWLPSEDYAVLRVHERVSQGGHNIPEETIRRRYHRGIANFFRLYQPIATTWRVYDNSARSGPRLVASGGINVIQYVVDTGVWDKMTREIQ